ncbi:MAG: SAM-dependent methyltransferase [Planctomycetota bacterium]
MANSKQESKFVFVICQNGAETAAKLEIAKQYPQLKFAFSRPGFLTFKLDAPKSENGDGGFPDRFLLRSVLARTFGWSIGRVDGNDAAKLVEQICQHDLISSANHLHVWQRDPMTPGKNGFEPGISPLADEIGKLFKNHPQIQNQQIVVNRLTQPDDLVFDVVMVEPDQWWYGYHFANTKPGRWPGGVPLVDSDKEVASRAFFKLQEALLWSGIVIGPGDLCAEIGSSPGGACELMLEMGAGVLGIDPAEMEPNVLEHPDFIHIRKRGHEVRKKEFRDVDWLMADLNLAPSYTMELVEEIAGHPSVNFKGVILTLKLSDWGTIQSVSKYIARLKRIGFQVVKARQLAFNRQEFCLVAIKDKFLLRSLKRSNKKRKQERS